MIKLHHASRRACGLALALMSGALILSGCSRGGAMTTSDQPVLKVASQKGATKALMLASHALDGAPYKVEWSEFAAAQTMLEAISAGAVDVGGTGDAPFLFAYANNPKLKIVQVYRSGSNGSGVAIVVANTSPIRLPSDLRGRKIATGKGSIGHYLLLRVLQRAGLKVSDVQVVYLSPGDAKAALSSGAVDAWATWTPFTSMETAQGGRVISDGAGLMNSYGFLASSDASIKSKRAQMTDFLGRLTKAQEWERGHVTEFAAALAKDTGLPEPVALDMVRQYLPQTVGMTPALAQEEKNVLQLFVDDGVIGVLPPINAAFDASFNTAAGG